MHKGHTPPETTQTPLLDVENLTTVFHTARGTVTAVDNVSFRIFPGRTLGLVGESGCGKSVTALSIMRLLTPPAGETVGGRIRFNGKDLLSLSENEMRSVRGNDISMIFQEPMTSLNPVFRIGEQVAEVIRLHKKFDKQKAWNEAVDLLRQVGIPAPERRAEEYPHQMSGGMRQRVMIAIALACSPRLIIADEPTTALDVTIQGQILDLMNELSRTTDAALMLITHDLGVVAETAEDVIVMYAGRIVEHATVAELFNTPLHPYTQGLMRSIPALPFQAGAAAQTNTPERQEMESAIISDKHHRLQTIPGAVPSLHALPAGCKFNDRCPSAFDWCFTGEPPLFTPFGEQHNLDCHGSSHGVRCWLHSPEHLEAGERA